MDGAGDPPFAYHRGMRPRAAAPAVHSLIDYCRHPGESRNPVTFVQRTQMQESLASRLSLRDCVRGIANTNAEGGA